MHTSYFPSECITQAIYIILQPCLPIEINVSPPLSPRTKQTRLPTSDAINEDPMLMLMLRSFHLRVSRHQNTRPSIDNEITKYLICPYDTTYVGKYPEGRNHADNQGWYRQQEEYLEQAKNSVKP